MQLPKTAQLSREHMPNATDVLPLEKGLTKDEIARLPPGPRAEAEAIVAALQVRTQAYRWPKGKSGNPGGQPRIYHECRRLAREASPDMMLGLIDLALQADDERVRSVCLIAVLDRAGVRAIDYDPNSEREPSPLDLSRLSPEQRQQLRDLLQVAASDAPTAEPDTTSSDATG